MKFNGVWAPASRCLAACGLLASLLLVGGTAEAGDQARRALALVKEMASRGEIPAGTALRLVVKQGNIASFLGEERELQLEWERETGVLIDASVMPQRASFEFIRDSRGVDLTIARNHELPDLLAAGLIEDLGPELRRHGFSLSGDGESGYLVPALQTRVGDSVVAVPSDFDAALLYVRRDMIEDPVRRAAYRERFQTELRIPRTWAEYQRQVEFFSDVGAGFYGALEPRERATAWMYWLPRYLSLASPVRHLFDENMRPLIDSPEGVAATRSFLATVPFSPPGIAEERNDYSYTLPFFLQGRGYSTIITIAGAKLAGSSASKIQGRLAVAPVPGSEVAGTVMRRPVIIYGNNLVLPRSSPHKKLALLYALWLTDEDVSLRSVGVPGGFSDPYRRNHLSDPRIMNVYSVEALGALAASLPDLAPPGTGLPGDADYLAALSDNLWLAARGEIGADEAMSRTAMSWERITERRGRRTQIRHWQRFRALYPDGRSAGRALPPG